MRPGRVENCTLRARHQVLGGTQKPLHQVPQPQCPLMSRAAEGTRMSSSRCSFVAINLWTVTLTDLHMQRPFFQIKSHSEIPVGHESRGNCTQPTITDASRTSREKWAPKTHPSSPGSLCLQPPSSQSRPFQRSLEEVPLHTAPQRQLLSPQFIPYPVNQSRRSEAGR